MKPDNTKRFSGGLKSLGICLGASTISLVEIQQDQANDSRNSPTEPRIISHATYPHDGNPRTTLSNTLAGLDLGSFDRIAATGRRFRNLINLTDIPEPEAMEYAYAHAKPKGVSCPAVVSAGGETFMVYVLDRRGQISRVLSGNKCASGTGEFLLQQLRRMDVSLEEAAQWAAEEEPYPVSGRCSVFCKSDCTHATNKGVPKPQVTAGLCRMMANKILELLRKVKKENIMVTGGTTQNRMVVAYLRQSIPGLIIPESAPYFEALGAALWALDHDTAPPPEPAHLFRHTAKAFSELSPLRESAEMVAFKSMEAGHIHAGDECILGLDVGSTTTKAVLIRTADDALLASVYLRTNGDPVGASRRCYHTILKEISTKVDPSEIAIIGLGVCGSGRQIAGLHALSDNVINEIVAHAAAAVYFDPDVDTLFEIGGQDAKYTYITNGVPSDYAMNEACSAGTGSFLEESAWESLGVAMTEIADIAMKGEHPPNFNDQCAAFIASDIKNAIHEGVGHDDIVAGLVYSICLNYANRVKGNRPVGRKVFMQGGVCYNRAIPLAMAALLGKPIVVPPEPGLMGAFGVALEVKKRISTGLRQPTRIDLAGLSNRTVAYRKSFTCRGGKEKCDRGCDIAVIEMEGKTYPFGGACNRYYNLREDIHHNLADLDLVRTRQKLIFGPYVPSEPELGKPLRRGTVGINRSFLTNTYYPLYATFFSELGFEPVLPSSPSREGIDQRGAAFCFPGELSHGFFSSLLRMEPPADYIFLPHIRSIDVPDDNPISVVCPLLQGEPFYLQTAFGKEIAALEQKGTRFLTPFLDLAGGLEDAQNPLVAVAGQMGTRRRDADKAFRKAMARQKECQAEMRRIGQRTLAHLEKSPDKIAVVLFARPYNGFVEEASMGIPHKFASRGILVIPYDFLPLDGGEPKRHMYWGMGRMILNAARIVKRHPQLFGTYVTNFSCGPDSFIIGYFRELMDRKPSLTLELDSHSADAGLETRVEAFLDIIASYRELSTGKQTISLPNTFTPARIERDNGVPTVITSSGESIPMTHPRVKLLIPSMGRLTSEALGAVYRGKGYNTVVHPPPDEAILKLGRAHTSCKECLPLLLTTGTLLNYIQNEKKDDDVLVYFMATGSGPCRFGQYAIFMEDLVSRLKLPDIAFFSLSSASGYGEEDMKTQIRGYWAAIISDVLEDVRSMILANARDPTAAIDVFDEQWCCIREMLGTAELPRIENQLRKCADQLGRIPMKIPPGAVPRILLTGEIFVRRDSISRQYLTEHLAEKGFATSCSPIAEWLHYCDYLLAKGLGDERPSISEKMKLALKMRLMTHYERRIKSRIAASGLIPAELTDIDAVVTSATPYISPRLTGEAILTVGSVITEVASATCGAIAIGPFGCMPNRLAEAILSETMTRESKLAANPPDRQLGTILSGLKELPFLAIESDGSPFPQLIDARIEAFCLSADRLHRRMIATRHPEYLPYLSTTTADNNLYK